MEALLVRRVDAVRLIVIGVQPDWHLRCINAANGTSCWKVDGRLLDEIGRTSYVLERLLRVAYGSSQVVSDASSIDRREFQGSAMSGRSGALRCNAWNVGSSADSRPSVRSLAMVWRRMHHRHKHSGNVFEATDAASLKACTSAGTSRSFRREPIGVEVYFVSGKIRFDGPLSAQPF